MNNRKESDKTRAESIDIADTLENATNASTRKLSSNTEAQSDIHTNGGADQTDNDEDHEDEDNINTV